MHVLIALVVAVGCESASSPPPPTPTPAPMPTPKPTPVKKGPSGPQLVVEVKGSLDWYVIGSKVVRTRQIALPSRITTMEWVGQQLVLLLEDNRVAVVDGDKLDFLPVPPASTWTQPRPAGVDIHLDPPRVRMFTKKDEVWLGHCEWETEGGLFSTCDHWVNARLRPLPMTTVIEHINVDNYGRQDVVAPPAPIAASTSIKAALVPDKERHQGKRDKLQCTDGGKLIEDPPVGRKVEPLSDVDSDGGRSDLAWLSTEPPIFQIADWDNCRPCPIMVIYERCKRSEQLSNVTFGPFGLMTFWTNRGSVVLYQRGRELAKFEDPLQVAFVPEK